MNDLETMQRVGVINLTNGGFTVVDPDRLEELNKFAWRHNAKGYIVRTNPGMGRHIYLHREVIGANPTDPDVDHRHGDRVDNRRDSLRFATASQNCANAAKSSNRSSRYKGVSWDKTRSQWHASIKVNYKCLNLGHFRSERAAGMAYNTAASKHFGEFARLNEIQ